MSEFVDIHTHSKSNFTGKVEILQINNLDEDLNTGSVGIHPWNVDSANMRIDDIENYLVRNKNVWVGEIGLDRVCGVDLNKQILIFETQLLLAEKYKRPIVIHNVRATSDIIQILKRNIITVPIIFHASNIAYQQVTQLLEYNCYFSFGETQLLSKKNQIVFTNLPLQRIFLETDASEVLIETVYELASSQINIPFSKLKEQLYANYKFVDSFSKNFL